MQESDQTPNWQPISFLPSIAEMIDGMLESAQEVHVSLQQARTRPHVMDDHTLGRVRQVHGSSWMILGCTKSSLRVGERPTRHKRSVRKSAD